MTPMPTSPRSMFNQYGYNPYTIMRFFPLYDNIDGSVYSGNYGGRHLSGDGQHVVIGFSLGYS
jgi:hypothetical protein